MKPYLFIKPSINSWFCGPINSNCQPLPHQTSQYHAIQRICSSHIVSYIFLQPDKTPSTYHMQWWKNYWAATHLTPTPNHNNVPKVYFFFPHFTHPNPSVNLSFLHFHIFLKLRFKPLLFTFTYVTCTSMFFAFQFEDKTVPDTNNLKKSKDDDFCNLTFWPRPRGAGPKMILLSHLLSKWWS